MHLFSKVISETKCIIGTYKNDFLSGKIAILTI